MYSSEVMSTDERSSHRRAGHSTEHADINIIEKEHSTEHSAHEQNSTAQHRE